MPPGPIHPTALAAEGTLPSEVEWTFLPLSACRHAVRTLSFPTLVGVGIWLVVSEDFSEDYFSLTFPADCLHPRYFYVVVEVTVPFATNRDPVGEYWGTVLKQKVV